ncbi:MAG: AI-2E family transporter [Gammaproteobacteria bacterium]|nr:MAG: AI-2E family transporter [Gammaproteobacteria bacterium]
MTINNRILITTISIAVIGFLIYALSPMLMPFAVSFVLAYIANPLVNRLQVRGLSRSVAVSIVFVLVFAVLIGLLLGVLPLLQRQLVVLISRFPVYLDWLQQFGLPGLQSALGIDLSAIDMTSLKKVATQHWQDLGGWFGTAVKRLSQSGAQVIGIIISLALIPLITFYLMRDWNELIQRLRGLLPPGSRSHWDDLARETDEVLASFLHGQLMVMVSLAIVYVVGLKLIGLEMALPIGVLAGLVSFVPYLGFITGIVAAGLAALFQFHEASALLGVAAVFITGQLLESFVLTPKLIGDRLGLHPVAVIFAVMAGGQLFGFVGVLIALPASAVLMVALRQMHKAYVSEPEPGAPARKRTRKRAPRRQSLNQKK